jgi:hypothetical protein
VLVLYLYFGTTLGFLWYNVIGTFTVLGVSLALSFMIDDPPPRTGGA